MQDQVSRAYFHGERTPSSIVAVPARNEAEHIGRCLRSLAGQQDLDGTDLAEGSLGVVVLLNNCTDASFAVAREACAGLKAPVRLYDVTMAPGACHAGGARRAAMELAAAWLDEGDRSDGLLLTTDADSCPQSDWLAANRRAIAQGVDCVAGAIDLDPEDALLLPAALHARGRLEAEYDSLLTELFSLLDPRPHDPWPRHAAEPGASLAITLHAYRAVGGMPSLALGEDRALVASLERGGFRVRHDLAVRVVTSGRTTGRADGGVADTIRFRCECPDAPCDPYLEPVSNALFRGQARGQLRAFYPDNSLLLPADWLTRLELPPDYERQIAAGRPFSDTWSALERLSPRLARQLLEPHDLPAQIQSAQTLLRRLRSDVAAACQIMAAAIA